MLTYSNVIGANVPNDDGCKKFLDDAAYEGGERVSVLFGLKHLVGAHIIKKYEPKHDWQCKNYSMWLVYMGPPSSFDDEGTPFWEQKDVRVIRPSHEDMMDML